jgi:hypothetical protein
MSSSKDGLLNQLKRQPGKAAGLGACLIMMIVIWGPMVFGGDEEEKKAPKPSPNAVSETSASSGGGAPNRKKATLASNSASKSPAKPVKSFKEALDRLDQWRVPLGMEKAEPLTREVIAMRRQEAQRKAAARVALEESARKARSAAEAGEDLPASLLDGGMDGEYGVPHQGADEDLPGFAPEVVDQVEITDLVLSGTAILGKTKMAFFEDRLIQEGQKIGRYLVKAVRSREVDLWADGRLTVLRMAPPDLEYNKQ